MDHGKKPPKDLSDVRFRPTEVGFWWSVPLEPETNMGLADLQKAPRIVLDPQVLLGQAWVGEPDDNH